MTPIDCLNTVVLVGTVSAAGVELTTRTLQGEAFAIFSLVVTGATPERYPLPIPCQFVGDRDFLKAAVSPGARLRLEGALTWDSQRGRLVVRGRTLR